MICAVSGYMNLEWKDKYAIMEADSLRERYALIERAVYEFIEESRVTQEAQSAQQESHEQTYREAAIKSSSAFCRSSWRRCIRKIRRIQRALKN